MNFAFLDEWHGFLPRTGGHVIVVRGGGGRSDLLRAMSRVLAAEGVPVAVIGMGGDDPEGVRFSPLTLSDHVVLYETAVDAATETDLPRRASLVITVSGLAAVGRPPAG
ncbi:hypothetical protein KKG45_11960, partial [bacterium]|nr:hypothetical protein [bacterium]